MSRIIDDDPPIKSHVANKAYRDNFDRIFGDPSGSSQGAEARQVAPAPDGVSEPERFVPITERCETCDAFVPDPENHRHAAAPMNFAVGCGVEYGAPSDLDGDLDGDPALGIGWACPCCANVHVATYIDTIDWGARVYSCSKPGGRARTIHSFDDVP